MAVERSLSCATSFSLPSSAFLLSLHAVAWLGLLPSCLCQQALQLPQETAQSLGQEYRRGLGRPNFDPWDFAEPGLVRRRTPKRQRKEEPFSCPTPGLVLTGQCMSSPRRSRAQHPSDAAWHEREAEDRVPEWGPSGRQ